jgi:hypothetical protein
VRISLASWTTLPVGPTTNVRAGDAVRDWLREHLAETFPLSHTAAGALVDAGMILPVLDGLDEMEATDLPAPASAPCFMAA